MVKANLNIQNPFTVNSIRSQIINNKNFFPLKIVLYYVLSSYLWVLLSDKFLLRMINNIETMNKFQTYKGSFFIIVTAIFLFILCSDLSSTKASLEKTTIEMEENKALLNSSIEECKIQSQFFANLSHDLKTPLNLIFTSVQILESNLRNTSLYPNKYITIIRQNCYRLIRLINNIVDISKYNFQNTCIHLKNYNIVQVVENISLSTVQHLESKGIELIFDTEIEEKVLACDPNMIERIMLNLLSNAVKFTPKGGTIFVNISDKTESLIISVKDTGQGIKKEKQKYIFNRFAKSDNSYVNEYKSSGLGLSIVKYLVEMHNGTIFCNSEYGKGSEFIIELPATTINEKSDDFVISQVKPLNDFSEKINIEFSDIYFD